MPFVNEYKFIVNKDEVIFFSWIVDYDCAIALTIEKLSFVDYMQTKNLNFASNSQTNMGF